MSNGAQAVVQCLHALSIRTLFGIPGTQSVSLFEALRQSDQVRVFLAEDERSAAFMANGFGRATGHTAAIATIPGPGVTHALSGIAEARSDSVSLLHLVISGDEPGSPRTRLQSSYREALTPTFYQSAHFARTASEIVSAFEQAWKTLQDGEPGPVLLEISANALDETCPSTLPAAQLSKVESFAPLVTRVLEAKRVSVLAGQGLCDAVPQFREVVNQRGWAVVTNCSARGVLPDAHPALVAPDFGSVGTSTVNQLFAQSDLVLVLGAKLTHNGTFGFQLDFPADRTHRLDRSPDVDDPERIKSWQGSCLAFLERLLEASGPSAGFPRETLLAMRAQFDHLREQRLNQDLRYLKPDRALRFLDQLSEALPERATVFTDSGRHQLVVRNRLKITQPRGLIVPSDFQSMGFALPAAVGAAASDTTRPVVAITGDGGFSMCGLTLSVAIRERLPLQVVIFNDQSLGQIRDKQLNDFGNSFATHAPAIDFQSMANALGAFYYRVSDEHVPPFAELFRSGGVNLIDLVLHDSPLPALRARAKSRARSLAGPRARAWLKRLTHL